jgi:hypothetical protein
MIQDVVVHEYEEEIERAKQPDYVSRYDEFDMDYADYRRAPQPPPASESRFDPPHERRGAHTGGNRPGAADAARSRGAAPKSSSRSRPTFDGFGAGIFPDE